MVDIPETPKSPFVGSQQVTLAIILTNYDFDQSRIYMQLELDQFRGNHPSQNSN